MRWREFDFQMMEMEIFGMEVGNGSDQIRTFVVGGEWVRLLGWGWGFGSMGWM